MGEMCRQRHFLQGAVEYPAMFSMQASAGATPGGPFQSKYPKIIQRKWVASRMVSARRVLSDYHLVVSLACLHINK